MRKVACLCVASLLVVMTSAYAQQMVCIDAHFNGCETSACLVESGECTAVTVKTYDAYSATGTRIWYCGGAPGSCSISFRTECAFVYYRDNLDGGTHCDVQICPEDDIGGNICDH